MNRRQLIENPKVLLFNTSRKCFRAGFIVSKSLIYQEGT